MSKSAQIHRQSLPYCHPLIHDLPPSKAAQFVAETFPREERKQRTVVDAGCGEGRDTIFLLKEGFRVMAVDVCEQNLRILFQKLAEAGIPRDMLECHCSDLIGRILAEGTSVDAVLDVWVLGSVILFHDGRFGAKRHLAEVHRILKPAGIFVSQFETHRPRRSCDELKRYFANLVKGRFSVITSENINADYALYLDVPAQGKKVKPAIFVVAVKE